MSGCVANGGGDGDAPALKPPPEAIQPSVNDVYCCRGAFTSTSPGNERYRRMVEDRMLEHGMTPSGPETRDLIASSIVRDVRALDPPGRFIDWDPKVEEWFDVGDEKARYETCRVLMENVFPNGNDVLCINMFNCSYPGNERFRWMLENRKIEYDLTTISMTERNIIACSILREIRALDPPGRFLDFNAATDSWYDVGYERARIVTCRALEEIATSILAEINKLNSIFMDKMRRDEEEVTRTAVAEAHYLLNGSNQLPPRACHYPQPTPPTCDSLPTSVLTVDTRTGLSNLQMLGADFSLVRGIRLSRHPLTGTFGILLAELNSGDGGGSFHVTIADIDAAPEEAAGDGTPALQKGDVIQSVNGTDVAGMGIEEVINRTRSTEEGVPLLLDVIRRTTARTAAVAEGEAAEALGRAPSAAPAADSVDDKESSSSVEIIDLPPPQGSLRQQPPLRTAEGGEASEASGSTPSAASAAEDPANGEESSPSAEITDQRPPQPTHQLAQQQLHHGTTQSNGGKIGSNPVLPESSTIASDAAAKSCSDDSDIFVGITQQQSPFPAAASTNGQCRNTVDGAIVRQPPLVHVLPGGPYKLVRGLELHRRPQFGGDYGFDIQEQKVKQVSRGMASRLPLNVAVFVGGAAVTPDGIVRRGDVIVSVNGVDVHDVGFAGIVALMKSTLVGRPMVLDVLRCAGMADEMMEAATALCAAELDPNDSWRQLDHTTLAQNTDSSRRHEKSARMYLTRRSFTLPQGPSSGDDIDRMDSLVTSCQLANGTAVSDATTHADGEQCTKWDFHRNTRAFAETTSTQAQTSSTEKVWRSSVGKCLEGGPYAQPLERPRRGALWDTNHGFWRSENTLNPPSDNIDERDSMTVGVKGNETAATDLATGSIRIVYDGVREQRMEWDAQRNLWVVEGTSRGAGQQEPTNREKGNRAARRTEGRNDVFFSSEEDTPKLGHEDEKAPLSASEFSQLVAVVQSPIVSQLDANRAATLVARADDGISCASATLLSHYIGLSCFDRILLANTELFTLRSGQFVQGEKYSDFLLPPSQLPLGVVGIRCRRCCPPPRRFHSTPISECYRSGEPCFFPCDPDRFAIILSCAFGSKSSHFLKCPGWSDAELAQMESSRPYRNSGNTELNGAFVKKVLHSFGLDSRSRWDAFRCGRMRFRNGYISRSIETYPDDEGHAAEVENETAVAVNDTHQPVVDDMEDEDLFDYLRLDVALEAAFSFQCSGKSSEESGFRSLLLSCQNQMASKPCSSSISAVTVLDDYNPIVETFRSWSCLPFLSSFSQTLIRSIEFVPMSKKMWRECFPGCRHTPLSSVIAAAGIRCRHCHGICPIYSLQSLGFYLQTMGHLHLAEECPVAPDEVRSALKAGVGEGRRDTLSKDMEQLQGHCQMLLLKLGSKMFRVGEFAECDLGGGNVGSWTPRRKRILVSQETRRRIKMQKGPGSLVESVEFPDDSKVV